jgi:hypothetical protein
MSIFDKLGGTNKFKKGMAAGAKPFEAKYLQVSEALDRLGNNFGKNWKESKEVADMILKSVEANERERLYGLFTQFDFKELESQDKEILIAVLYTLSAESSNEFQQSYIRSVQKYLDIKNPQTKIGFEGIENIDSQKAQKAIFQACVEFLLLKDGGPGFFDKYEETLFSYFALKEKDAESIWDNALQIYSATGPLGLAEKFGFVPEFKDKQKVLAGEESLLEEFLIDDILHIPSGQEKVIEGKQIVFRDVIKCEGKLVLKNCIIIYNGDNIRRQINLGHSSTLVLNQCTIVGNNNETRNEKRDKYFINGEGYKGDKEKAKLEAENCLFLNCLSFADNVIAVFKKSAICYTKLAISFEKPSALDLWYDEFRRKKNEADGIDAGTPLKEGKSFFDIDFTSHYAIIEIYDSLIDMQAKADKLGTLFKTLRSACNCTFKNATSPIATIPDYHNSRSDVTEIKNCLFDNCNDIISGTQSGSYFITGCVFKNCNDILRMPRINSKVSNCQFIKCGGTIIDVSLGEAVIEHCEFINVINEEQPLPSWGIRLGLHKDYKSVLMQNCTFDGINHSGFITYNNDKNPVFGNKSRNITIENCVFKHCVAGVLDRKNRHPDNNADAITISNCTGLDGFGGGKVDNATAWEKTSKGEPIGTTIKESDVGVPIYQPG